MPKAERPGTRCPSCKRYVPLLKDGRTFGKHTTLEKGSVNCRMSRHRAPSPIAGQYLLKILEAAFFEHYGLAYGEWDPDADEVSAARAAFEALRKMNVLVVDGQVYLVTESREISESDGERRWAITTDDGGELHGQLG